ncbi:MAG: PKD domain-containing protein [Thermoplasmata archaeon]
MLVAVGLPSIGPVEANTGCPESTSNFGIQTINNDCDITNPTTWENGVLTIAGDMRVSADLTLNNMTIRFNSLSHEQYTMTITGGDMDWFNSNMESATSQETKIEAVTGAGAISIRNGRHSQINWDFSNGDNPVLFENNIDGPTDARGSTVGGTLGQHMWLSANATIRWNTFQGITVDDGAVMVNWGGSGNWGNGLYWGNTIGLRCEWTVVSNCMGIEVISVHSANGPLAPYPSHVIAWNNFTYDYIAANTDSNMIDIEFAQRLYIHNNTGSIDETNNFDTVTEFLLSGGAQNSVYENNTGYGLTEAGLAYTYCIYHFIYTDSDVTWQYNSCDDARQGSITTGTGLSTYRHNTMTNVTGAGWQICEQCGGGDPGGGHDLAFYNNTFDYASGAVMMWMEITVEDFNTYLTHGNGQTTQWCESFDFDCHVVPGEGNFLYHAEDSIEALRFANESDGDRRVTMTADGGNEVWDIYSGFGATDNAALTLTGNIDRSGSQNLNNAGSGTFLWELGRDRTDVDVLATGDVTFAVESFYASTTYDIWVDGSLSSSFNTDSSGAGSFIVNFASQRNVVIIGAGMAPPDNNPPTASFAFSPSAPVVDENVTFDASSSSDDVGITSYDWDFDNGDLAQGQTVTYAYPAEGSYNVTLTVRDAAGNADSMVSQILVAPLPPPADVTAPAAVTDLVTVVVNNEYVILQWVAPGDDGGVGQAATYDVRYSTTGALDDATFGAAAPVPGTPPLPASPGSTERLNVSGLSPATQYWFALRTADEVPNWSPVSNSVNATTLQNATDVDDTPPTVTVTSPARDSVITGAVVVAVEASDDTGVVEVVILLDGSLATSMSEAPYLWVWLADTASPGPHTLRAEATDPTGNVGSDEVQVVVLPTGITPETGTPRVVGLLTDPNAGRFDIQFSEPMDRGSVNLALSIEPMIGYQPTWRDDFNLTVTLQEASQPNLIYTLSVDDSATSAEGISLRERFAFRFIGTAATEEAGVSPDMWLPISLLLAVGLVAMGGLHLWTRKGSQQMRKSMRQLALRLEELNSASQARIYQELSDLEGLVSRSVSAAEGRPRQLTRAR